MKEESRKKVVLLLRWAVIIATSYFMLFAKGRVVHLDLGQILVLGYIATNIALFFLPKPWFSAYPSCFISTVILSISFN
jgi:uncharacterized membrane protein